MKKKDIVYVVIAVVIIAVAGYLITTQIMPQKSGKTAGGSVGTEVDVIGPISKDFNATSLSKLQDATKSLDYTVTMDLSTGLGNTALFGR